MRDCKTIRLVEEKLEDHINCILSLFASSAGVNNSL